MKPEALRRIPDLVLFTIASLIIYAIWAIQPMPFDDWLMMEKFLNIQPLPTSGNKVRYTYDARNIFYTHPLSLIKIYSGVTSLLVCGFLWKMLSRERLALRFILTLIVTLGYPYLGHIGPWNMAGTYTMSVIWVILWYLAYKQAYHSVGKTLRYGASLLWLFVITLWASVWLEVWLIVFPFVAGFVLFDGLYRLWIHKNPRKGKEFLIALVTMLGYATALWYYTRGGAEQFVDGRMGEGRFASIMNVESILRALKLGTKEICVQIKDLLPIGLFLLFIRLHPAFKTRLEKDFRLFCAFLLGSLVFFYVIALIVGAPHWRVRWLCGLPMVMVLYAFPQAWLERFFHGKARQFIRWGCLALACVWLLYNAYFTYIYTHVDAKGWLQYRQMVMDRDPRVLEGLCCRTKPIRKDARAMIYTYPWGVQDDRYRYVWPPSFDRVKENVLFYWEQHPE